MHAEQFAGIATAVVFVIVIILEFVWAATNQDKHKIKSNINKIRLLLLLIVGVLWGIVGLLIKLA